MDGVSVASGVAGLLTLTLQIGGTLAIYVNSIKERDKNIRELCEELQLLGEVLSSLQEFLLREQAKGRAFDEDSVLQNAIRDCRARIERIGERLRPLEGGKVARAIEKLKWPFEQREVMQMTENLRRFIQTFQFAFTIEGCTLLSKTSEDATKGLEEMLQMSRKITELSTTMGISAEDSIRRSGQLEEIITLLPLLTRTTSEITELAQVARIAELREQEQRTTDILDWLAPLPSLHKHRDMQAKRAAGTGKWFLEHHGFQNWMEDLSTDRDLLCVGAPGAGKSVLSSMVVDHLRDTLKDQEVAVAYYYYDYSEQQSQTVSNFARALLRQLCSASPNIPSSVADFYQRTRNDVKDQTWFHDLLSVLRRVSATYRCCFIIVDALDEADIPSQRSGIFEVLNSIRCAPGTLKVMATSRPHTMSGGKFHNPTTVDIAAHPADLRRYLTQTIAGHPDSEYTMDDGLKEHVIKTLCEKANGMFLLPALQVQAILDQITKADVRRALGQLSTNLTEAFSSTIQRISNLSHARRDLAFRTLMWVSHAKRPLAIAELQHALAIRPEDKDLDTDNCPSLRTILDCCCGLVEVDQDTSTVRLVHHSLEEYLQSHDHGLFKGPQILMTRACLKYIVLDSVKPLASQNRADFAASIQALPFLEYASVEWARHAYNLAAVAIQDLAIPILTDNLCLRVIARARDHRTPDFRKWKTKTWDWADSGGAGISLCAGYGLAELLQILLDTDDGHPVLDARNMYGSTPLHEAAMHGHENTATLLIEYGANVLDTNYGQNTPLYLATAYGQVGMVKMLLKHGRGQLDCAGAKGLSPLHKAVDQGDEDMVTVLLDEGALVASHDNTGATPLHLAAKRGYLSISKLLIQSGAFVHVKDNEGLCPLDYAATGGFTELVALLHEHGGGLWHKGREMWTPLHRAARGGHTETVSFLLAREADVLAADFRGNIPLHLSVRSGKMETTIRILHHRTDLKHAQLSARDRKGSTPRDVAFFTAHYDIHKYLRSEEQSILDNHAKPSTTNLLTAAIEKGDLSQVQTILLSASSTINNQQPDLISTPDSDGQPPLHIAIQEQHVPIATLLLHHHHAPINQQGYHGWHALHIAASLGNLELVDLCLSHHASVTARTHTNQTPLHKAASSNSPDVVRRLLQTGADPEAMNDRGMTALHIAAHQDRLQIVRMLVWEFGVDVHVRDRRGLTAAMWAERSAHLDMLAFLRVEMKRGKGKGPRIKGLMVEGKEDGNGNGNGEVAV